MLQIPKTTFQFIFKKNLCIFRSSFFSTFFLILRAPTGYAKGTATETCFGIAPFLCVGATDLYLLPCGSRCVTRPAVLPTW